MKGTSTRTLLSLVIALAMLVAGSVNAHASGLDVLGGLDIQGQVQIVAEGAKAPLKLSDTSYTYVAGDTIKNGDDTTSVLELDSVGRIGLASNASASVTRAGSSINVKLIAGTLVYALEPGADVSIQVAGMTLRPELAPIRLVSTDHNVGTTGWVDLDKDGKVHVAARTGNLTASQGGVLQSVSAGEEAVLKVKDGQLILAQALGASSTSNAGAASSSSTASKLLTILVSGVLVGEVACGIFCNESGGGGLASP